MSPREQHQLLQLLLLWRRYQPLQLLSLQLLVTEETLP